VELDKMMAGDLSAVTAVAAAPHDGVVTAWQGSKEHELSSSAVRRVLRQLLDGTADPASAQLWASFVMRGYLEPVGPPIRPLTIEYEQVFEDEIVEALHYLDQIGDLIDGDVEPGRLAELLAALERAS
jgi:hypothetical protein